MGLRSYNLCPVVGESPIDCLGVKVQLHAFTVKKNLPGVGVGEWWGNGGGKATAVMPHGGGGGEGHWSMDNSPTPPQVGGGGGGGGGLSLIGALEGMLKKGLGRPRGRGIHCAPQAGSREARTTYVILYRLITALVIDNEFFEH